MKKITFALILIAALTACDPNVSVNAPVTTPAATPAISQPTAVPAAANTPACPAIFNLPTQGQTNSAPTFWVCDSGCGSLPFTFLMFSLGAPSGSAPYGAASIQAGDQGNQHSPYATNGNINSLTPIVNGNIYFGSSIAPWGPVPIGTTYPAELNCNELIVDGVTFTYSTTGGN